jgi:hypothetical protein
MKTISLVLLALLLSSCEAKHDTSQDLSGWDTVKVQVTQHQLDSLKNIHHDGEVVYERNANGDLITYFVLYHMLYGGNVGHSYYYASPTYFYSSPHRYYNYSSPKVYYSSPSYRSSSSSSTYRSPSPSSSKSTYRSGSSTSTYRSSSSSSSRSGGRR